MTIRVGINGFGRIGRNFYRAVQASGADIEIVAANDLGDLKTMAHLLKYDSILGRYPADVSVADGGIHVGDSLLRIFAERDPADLEWGDAFRLNPTGRARGVCHGDTALPAPGENRRVLKYGTTIRLSPNLRCTSRRTGMTCSNNAGHGFKLSRTVIRLF